MFQKINAVFGSIILLICGSVIATPVYAQDSNDDVPDFTQADEAHSEIKQKYEAIKQTCREDSQKSLSHIQTALKKLVDTYPGISLKIHKDGALTLELPNTVLFASGSNFLIPESERMLREIRQVLIDKTDKKSIFLQINLWGHTDTDKMVGNPNYTLAPRTNTNEKQSLETRYDHYGLYLYHHDKQYRQLPVTENRHVLVDITNAGTKDAWAAALEYNYLLGLNRAQVVHYYIFETGDDQNDVSFSQHRNIRVTQGSFAFIKPRVSNAPVIYRSSREASRAKARKRPNRRVEIEIQLWNDGIDLHYDGKMAIEVAKAERQALLEMRGF